MEAQAARALLSHAWNALHTLDAGMNAEIAQNEQTRVCCLGGEEPTWQEKMEREITQMEARLENGQEQL
jgi:hypothetical protein